MQEGDLRELLQQAAAVLNTPDYAEWHASFVAAYCHAFEAGDESALECSSIHQEYVAGAEARLEAALTGASYQSMIDAITGLGARTPRALLADDGAAEAIDKLVSLTDYATFKEIMLVAKAEHGAAARSLAVDVNPGDDAQLAASGMAASAATGTRLFRVPDRADRASERCQWVGAHARDTGADLGTKGDR